MQCCQVTEQRRKSTGRFFGWFARSYARSFRRGGLEKIQELLLAGVRASQGTDLAGRRVLDVGCGVGALHLTLLREGAGSAQGVDLSRGMLDQAAELARSMHLGDRVEYTEGDIAALNGEVKPADVTVMDKVVCCYEDAPALIARTAELTRETLALSHPRDFFWIRWVWQTHAFFAKLLRFNFYPCWHHWPDVTRMVLDRGFTESYRARTFLWEVAVYTRTR